MSFFDIIPLQREIDFLWRAIDLLVQELGHRGDVPQKFRDDWAKLVEEVKQVFPYRGERR